MLLRDALVGIGAPRRRPHRRTGMRGLARAAGPALTQVPMWESLSAGRTGSSAAQDTTGRKIRHRRPDGAGGRDKRPVTMTAEDPGRRAGSHGGASLAPNSPSLGDRIVIDQDADHGGPAPADATDHPYRRCPPRCTP